MGSKHTASSKQNIFHEISLEKNEFWTLIPYLRYFGIDTIKCTIPIYIFHLLFKVSDANTNLPLDDEH